MVAADWYCEELLMLLKSGVAFSKEEYWCWACDLEEDFKSGSGSWLGDMLDLVEEDGDDKSDELLLLLLVCPVLFEPELTDMFFGEFWCVKIVSEIQNLKLL